MKTIKILFATIVACITFQSVNAQSGKENLNDRTKTQTVKVYGQCGMCKKRIEKAASTVKGVQSVSWNEDTQMLTLKYDLFKKEAVENVQKKIASVGHDTEKYKADDAAYANLPGCCHYQRKQ
jgi:periplasmic mercuric ion binding protein